MPRLRDPAPCWQCQTPAKRLCIVCGSATCDAHRDGRTACTKCVDQLPGLARRVAVYAALGSVVAAALLLVVIPVDWIAIPASIVTATIGPVVGSRAARRRVLKRDAPELPRAEVRS